MNRFNSFLLSLLAVIGISHAQEYTVTLEEHATEIVPGLTTYRLYVDMVNADDFLSSVYGGDTAPLSITTTTGFYNDAFGAVTADGINPAFLAFFPEMAADSWVTIGIDSQSSGDQVAPSTLQSTDQPWTDCFASGSEFDGQDVFIDDDTGGAWYILNGAPNGLPDENLRVLAMQMTTDGEICGTMNFQIFINGDGQDGDVRLTYTFCGAGTYAPNPEGDGCVDVTACNFDPAATVDDGSCEYAEFGYDCDGNCLNDTDADGICDEFETPGCTDVFACNYDAAATDDNATCEYSSCLGCTDVDACNYDPEAVYNDGSCDYVSCATPGCTNANACNYNPEADLEDGTCEYSSCVGCTDETACNYDPIFTLENGSCEYAPEYYDCDGNCLMDMDGDGVCDELEVVGCMDMMACNYDMTATDDSGMCEYAEEGYDCAGNCLTDTDGDGVCDEFEVQGCQDTAACNYNTEATDADDSCVYADSGYDCDGNCLNDADMDGVCDEFEIDGCMDELACNYAPSATDDDGTCEYPDEFYDCDGNCLNDADMDGVCDELEIAGCMDESACNYNAEATDDDGMCEYAQEFYDCDGNCLNDADMDGVCDELEIAGCTDAEAANYDVNATDDDGSCYYCDIDLITESENETDGDASGSVNLIVSGGTFPYEFSWTGPDSFTSSEPTLSNLSAGTYVLTVTDTNGCEESIEVIIENVVSVAEIDALTFDVYPNPSNGEFWIQGGSNLTGMASVEVMDASGRLITSKELYFNGAPMQLHLGGVESGYYLVVLSNSKQAGVSRLFVH